MNASDIKAEVSIERLVAYYGGNLNGKGQGRCLLSDRHSHGDANPSMTVHNGRVVCWSQQCFGHKGADIFELVGVMEHLTTFPEQRQRVCEIAGLNGNAARNIVATYDYTDESGVLLHQTVRYEPKTFAQRRPNGSGGWIWNLHETRLVLYHLPRIMKATHVLILEGEKDCETADRLGWPHPDWAPTTNAMGAEKWRDDYTQTLLGKTVVICPDTDEKGHQHLALVAETLRQAQIPVCVLHLPEDVKDLSDWQDHGGTTADFWRLLAHALPWEPELPDTPDPLLGMGLGAFLALTFPPTCSLIEGLLSDDGGGWISGEEKLGKSYYAIEEALCLALGLPVCGRFAVPARCKVLFIEEEDSPARAHRRVKQLLRGHGLDPDDPALRADLDAWFQISVWAGFTLDDTAKVDQLRQTIEAFHPVVVYLDVLRKLTTRNLNKGEEAGALLKVLDDLRREFGALFRVLAHNRKIQGSFRAGRGSQEIAGSHQLGAWGENSLFFEPVGKQGAIKITVQCKDSAPVPAFGLRFETEGPAHDHTLVRLHAEEVSTAAEETEEEVFEAISSLPPEEATSSGTPGVSRESLSLAIKKSSATTRTAIQALIEKGRVIESGKASKQKKLYQVNAQ